MDILLLLFIVSFATGICAWLYHQKFMRKIVLFGHVDLIQIVNSIVTTTIFIIFFLLSYIFIFSDSQSVKGIFDSIVLGVMFLFAMFSSVGVGVHFTGKCLSKNLKNHKHKKVRDLSYVFHIFLGHHLIYFFAMVELFVMGMYNIFRPSIIQISFLHVFFIILFGFLWALSWSFSMTFPPIDRKIYIFLGGMFSFLLAILFFFNDLNLLDVPYTVFYFSTIFFIFLFIIIVSFIEKARGMYIGKLIFGEDFDIGYGE